MSEPYYRDDHVELWLGDCREVTVWLEADVLVTDPPYGRGWAQPVLPAANRRTKGRTSHPRESIANDHDAGARDQALRLWGKDRLAVSFGHLTAAVPDRTAQVLVYRKPRDAGIRGAKAGRRRDLEAVYLIGPWPQRLGGVSSLIETTVEHVAGQYGLSGRNGHPHAKPVDVMTEIIGLAPTALCVADPFAGSGSTLVAAKLQGRRAIGVELEERYCELAARRLAQDALFGAAS